MGIIKFSKPHRNVTDVDLTVDRLKSWEQWVLLSSDRHHDNPHSNWDLEIEHLEQAKERMAPILDFGDLFCAMQGRYDKRSNKSAVRPEHQNDQYLDSLVDTAAEFYEPYAPFWAMMAAGNHEGSILKNHETNLNERLIAILNNKTKSKIQYGHMQGFVRIRFFETSSGVGKRRRAKKGAKRTVTKKASTARKPNPRQTITLAYHHGWGGGGLMSFDTLNVRRRAGVLPDADVVVSGHTHDAWHLPIPRMRLTQGGTIIKDLQHHIKIPSYKDSFADGAHGWEVSKGMAPKPLGCVWLRFYWDTKAELVKLEVRVDARGG